MNKKSSSNIPRQNNDGKHFHVNLSHLFLFFLLFVSLFGVFKIIEPYVNTIILAIILAMIFNPVNKYLQKWVGKKPNLSAFLTCTVLVLVVVIPLSLILLSLIRQGVQSFESIQEWLKAGNLQKVMDSALAQKIIELINRHLPNANLENMNINQDLVKISSGIGGFLLDQGGSIVGNVTSTIAKFFLMIFIFFFLVRDGEKIAKGILHLIPLSGTHEKEIIQRIGSVSRSAVTGTILTALAQGAAGGIGLAIAGLPGLFWGTMMAFASLVPLVGTALIWVPAAAYLFITGSWGFGIFFVIWSIVVVGSIDNFLRPFFMGGSSGMSPLILFFSILGGIQLFGLIGIVYGPLVFGIALVLLYIYELEFSSYLKTQDEH